MSDARVLRAGQSWASDLDAEGCWWLVYVIRVARDNSWADLEVSHGASSGSLSVWTKRQPLGADGLPQWFAGQALRKSHDPAVAP